MITMIQKDRHGWEATTDIEVSDTMLVRVSTYKRRGNTLETRAEVYHRTPGSRMISRQCSIGGIGTSDYGETVLTEPRSRVTRPLVEEQHYSALSIIDPTIRRVRDHYQIADVDVELMEVLT